MEQSAMQPTHRFRQTLLSAAVFCALLLAVASVNPRVRERLETFVHGGELASLDNRATEVGSALVVAAKHQSIDNAPLMIFAVVGAILFVFMFRT
jgi:hypothetical protein